MDAIIEKFRNAIQQAGLLPPKNIIADGHLHRFPTNGLEDLHDNAGFYVLHGDGIPAGMFGDWRTGVKQTWCAQSELHMTGAELVAYRERIETIQRQREEEQQHHAVAAIEARRIWDTAKPAPESHGYLGHKRVLSYGLRLHHDGRLIVPVRDVDGELHSLEFIDANGTKRFLPYGKKRGHCYVIGCIDDVMCVVEGYATGASVYEATGYPVIVAFDAGNLKPVAHALRAKYPHAKLIVCGDNDRNQTGQRAAQEAAAAVNGLFLTPDVEGDDWNDVMVKQGGVAVQTAINAVLNSRLCVVDELYKFLGRFVAYPSEPAHVAHTLWILHTHIMDAWESTPRIAFLSPEPSSGKTRALEVTETVVPRPVEAVNVTAAYLFRKVSDPKGLPTILFDEIDTVFGPRAKEHEEIRAILNAGHRRGAMAGRCVLKGSRVMTEELPAFCAVAVAGLGNLPDTILTRSVVVKMRRRAPTEQVESYRRRIHAPEGNKLRERLAIWAKTVGSTLNLYPDMPESITDRSADVWEALLSVADAVGGPWPERARVSAVSLVDRQSYIALLHLAVWLVQPHQNHKKHGPIVPSRLCEQRPTGVPTFFFSELFPP